MLAVEPSESPSPIQALGEDGGRVGGSSKGSSEASSEADDLEHPNLNISLESENLGRKDKKAKTEREKEGVLKKVPTLFGPRINSSIWWNSSSVLS